ncbi:MAG: HK97 family phage prohead protease [Candidatus Brocadiales bacterium]|nr:HK97 family phage prohead protease [Candidatus Bathyanammoxibius amoris]
MEMERKNFKLKELTDKGEGSAIIATLNVIDSDGDVTLPGAFGVQTVKVLPAHNWMNVPLGKAVTREKDDKVIADFQLNLDIPDAKDWYSALKFDLEHGESIQEWSYGYNVKEHEEGEHNGQQVRFLKLIEAFEISPVLKGAGVGTQTLMVKENMEYFKQAEQTLADVIALVERSEELASLRAKDGRSLNAANKERLEKVLASLADVETRIKTLLEDGGSGEEAVKLFAEYQRTKHELNLAGILP